MGRSRSRSPRRSRSRSPRGGGGSNRGSSRNNSERISLLVRNLPDSSRTIDELRRTFERYGFVKDVYIPTDYYTRRPKPFAFVEFTDYNEARDAKEGEDRRDFMGKVIDVVFAQHRRKSPGEMRGRDDGGGYGGRGGGDRGGYDRRGGGGRGRSRSPPRRRERDDSRSPRRGRSRSGSPRRDRDRSPARKDSRSPRRDSPRRDDSPKRARSGSPAKKDDSRGGSPPKDDGKADDE